MRRWDRATADRVDHFIANSRTVAGRIAASYGRDATVIYPPVETEQYAPPEDVPDYGRGGALESVRDGVTGILFPEQTVEAMMDAMRRVQAARWNRLTIVAHARQFDAAHFRARITDFLADAWERHRGSNKLKVES
jgi:hypothetical protein